MISVKPGRVAVCRGGGSLRRQRRQVQVGSGEGTEWVAEDVQEVAAPSLGAPLVVVEPTYCTLPLLDRRELTGQLLLGIPPPIEQLEGFFTLFLRGVLDIDVTPQMCLMVAGNLELHYFPSL